MRASGEPMTKLPVVTSTQRYEVRFVNGQPIFDLREQILVILSRDANTDEFGSFFAEPIVNHSKGEISWYTHNQGSIRSFSELTSLERGLASNKILDIDKKLRSTADRLSISNPQGKWLGDAIRSMLLVPNLDNSLFLVGEKIVLTQWGCIPFGSDPGLFDIVVQDASTRIDPSDDREVAEHVDVTSKIDPVASPTAISEVDQQYRSTDTIKELPLQDPQSENFSPADSISASWWSRNLAWLLALLLLITLLIGLLTHLYIKGSNNEVALLRERAQIDLLWSAIAEKSRRCVLTTPPASNEANVEAPTLNPQEAPTISPQEVETTLQDRGVTIGEQVNVSLVWNSPVDLDLIIIDPSGVSTNFSSRRSPTGGTLDIDANANCRALMDPAVENISWNSLPMPGNYTIRVNFYSACGHAPTSIQFKIIITRQNTPDEVIEGTVTASQKDFTHEFAVRNQ